ncbi:unnamed protein product [Mycena citricolor]|uniref:Uncharacterized protein n=1 Tax=Mycena citricolor TaxID=2018698 RepID=A0AAD2GTD3_9AGAR|nr:unnamed protein product [Mycena citricolor]
MSIRTANASNALWGQLLRKSAAPDNNPLPIPPGAPLDKTGTSMRILLHDTQANFEKFSGKVQLLTTGLEETKREISVAKDLFKGAQDALKLDILELVNRAQTRLQKSIGDPVQTSALESLRQDMDSRLGGLVKRIDEVQSFNHTQALALQNACQMLQNLQEQQCKILTTLLPMLPLLQAVPVQIDSVRSCINESMLTLTLETNHPYQQLPTSEKSLNKRSFAASASSLPQSPKRKKPDQPVPAVVPSQSADEHFTGSFVTNDVVGPGHPPVKGMLQPQSVARHPLHDLPLNKTDAPTVVASSSPEESAQSSSVVSAPPLLLSPIKSSTRLLKSMPKWTPSILPVKAKAVINRTSMNRASSMAIGTAAIVRGRRSPFRDGRRFISLDDDDSDSDEGTTAPGIHAITTAPMKKE